MCATCIGKARGIMFATVFAFQPTHRNFEIIGKIEEKNPPPKPMLHILKVFKSNLIQITFHIVINDCIVFVLFSAHSEWFLCILAFWPSISEFIH